MTSKMSAKAQRERAERWSKEAHRVIDALIDELPVEIVGDEETTLIALYPPYCGFRAVALADLMVWCTKYPMTARAVAARIRESKP